MSVPKPLTYSAYIKVKCSLSVGVVVTDIAGGLGSIPGRFKSDIFANSSSPLRRFCVAQALNRVNVVRYSSHASA